jgi:DNA-directed RNA polymerase specialized sigma24 family protein
VVPASSRKSLARRERKGKKKVRRALEPELISPLADAGPWAGPKEPPPLSAEASDPRRLVRPYTRTGGRTHSGYRLELETLLSTQYGRDRDIFTLRDDYRMICELCRLPQSVAEIAARLGLPLGAARVLISDLVPAELLYVHEVAAEDGPSVDLLSRVAAGLKKL